MTEMRFVLVALKPDADREEYERFLREVDYVTVEKMESITYYRTHRLKEPVPLPGGPWDYIEVFHIADRKAYESEASTIAKDLIDTLYNKYLDRSKTVSIWTECVEP